MRGVWLYALPLALAAIGPANVSAAGRAPIEVATAAAGAPADGYGTYIYADVLKPHGRPRSQAVKRADGGACDGGDSDKIATPEFEACMRARGWRLDHFEPAAPGTYLYADMLKPKGRARGDAARQSAANVCDGHNAEDIGTPAFNACMLAHGWRFVASVPQPPSYDAAAQDAADEEANDDEQRRNNDMINNQEAVDAQAATDAATAAAQQQFNDGMAAAQQQMNQAVFIQQ